MPEKLTKAEMATRTGISVEVFDEEIKNAGQRPSHGPNRAQRREMKRRGRS